MPVHTTPEQALTEAKSALTRALALIDSAMEASDPAVRSDHARQAQQISGHGSRLLGPAIEAPRPRWGAAGIVLPGASRSRL